MAVQREDLFNRQRDGCPLVPLVWVSTPWWWARDDWRDITRLRKRAVVPTRPPSLGEFVVMVSQMGGYLNNRSDKGVMVVTHTRSGVAARSTLELGPETARPDGA